MTNYTYLGWGTTDSNGVAKLDHDANDDPLSHSYTGSGVGEVDVVASLDKPIVSGSVVSQPSTVIDAICYDTGISGTANDSMWNDINSILKRTSDYSYLDGVLWNTIVVKLNNSQSLPFNNGICVELDVVEVTGQCRIVFYDGSNHQNVWNSLDQYDDVGHWKFTLKDGKFKAQYNNGTPFEIGDFNTSVSTFTAKLECYTNFQSFKFKNFTMYPV